jgi:deazaflavin-dependent oxidoreductase (nitroreductase family)
MSIEKPIQSKNNTIGNRLFTFYTRAHVFLYRLTGGMIGGRVGKSAVLLLMTVGRKSGKEYTTPLFYLADGNRFVLVASNRGTGKLPNWWLNMRDTSVAHIQVGRRKLAVTAKQAEPEERQRLWSQLVAQYADYDNYQKQTPYDIPVIILRPTS